MTKRSVFAVLACVSALALQMFPAVANSTPMPRIVGGQIAEHRWPAQANLAIGGSPGCGGTLVAARWVLTAAHCVTDGGSVLPASEFVVTLGSTKLDGNGGSDFAVTKVVRDPDYDPSTMENDAALLRLINPSHSTPLALIGNDSEDDLWWGRVLGWGDTEDGGDQSQDLREVDLPIVDDSTCEAAYGSEFFADTMFCAGYEEGGADSCQGDSGGPLMVDTGSGTATGSDTSNEGWKLAGIVSWGDGCAQPGKYGVYTDLRNGGIRDWIYSTIDGLPTGLQNPSFEQPLGSVSDWTATVYDSEGEVVRSGSDACPGELTATEAQRRICRVGTDVFEVNDGEGSRQVSVSPLDGNFMLRLGGPFGEAGEDQAMDRYVAKQTFVVDPAEPILHLNYDMFTFDYTNFDELRLRVRLFDADGDVVFNKVVGSFGPSGDISFKTTGWRSANVDLSSLAGDEVTLRLDSGGTQDNLYGFWTYVDAGTVPEVVSQPGDPEVPSQTPAGQPVLFQVQEDANGLTYYNFAYSSVSAFESAGQCLTMKLPVPINPGAGSVSNVSLLLDETAGGDQQVPLEDSDANNVWTVPASSSGLCAHRGTLYVSFTLTENGVSQDFVVPLGGITLIDPQGTVYDKARFETDVDQGMSSEEALADAALGGAVVRLEREVEGAFQPVLSGDPGISPNVNPQITPASGPSKGLFQWDVAAGNYRVSVSHAGFLDATSMVVSIPPEVTGLNIGMVRPGSPPPPTPPGTPPALGSSSNVGSPALSPAPKNRCAGKKGLQRKRCLLAQKRKAALKRCRKLKGEKRAACIRHAQQIGHKNGAGGA